MTLTAPYVGEEGFVAFIYALRRLNVLTTNEFIGWVGLHREVMKLLEPPMDVGSGVDEETFAGLLADLGATEEMS